MGNSTNAETRVCCPLRIASVGVLDTTRCWLPCTTTDRMLSLRHPTCTSMACKISQEFLILMLIAASASGATAPVHEFRNYAPEPVPSVLEVRTPTQSFRTIWILQAILRIMAGIAGMLPNVRAGFCPPSSAAVFGRGQGEGPAHHVGRQCLQVVAGRRTSAAKAPVVLPGAACTVGCSGWVCGHQACAGRRVLIEPMLLWRRSTSEGSAVWCAGEDQDPMRWVDMARKTADGAEVGSGQQRRFRRHQDQPPGAEDSSSDAPPRQGDVDAIIEEAVQERMRPQSRRELRDALNMLGLCSERYPSDRAFCDQTLPVIYQSSGVKDCQIL